MRRSAKRFVRGFAPQGGWLVVSLRPYNPEGVSFLHRVELETDRKRWRIEDWPEVTFSEAADRHCVSEYHHGDVANLLPDAKEADKVVCDVGMATAAALFRLEPGIAREIRHTVPLESAQHKRTTISGPVETLWSESLENTAQLQVPDPAVQSLYDTALRTLVLHAPDDVYPGPYTYKRFWFRDAAFIIHAMLCAGMMSRSKRALDRFAPRQTAFGYFHSQEGEWDSNGEALWIYQRYCDLTNTQPSDKWLQAIRKRCSLDCAEAHRNRRRPAARRLVARGIQRGTSRPQ
jgi:hypothetical protein